MVFISTGNQTRREEYKVLKKLLTTVAILGTFSIVIACGENTPPKGSHEPVKPAAVPAAQQPSSAPPSAAPVTSSSSSSSSAASSAAADKELAITLQDENGDYAYNPGEITVRTGETVKFTLTAQGEFHTFTVDDLGIDLEVEPGDTQSITFTFDEPGSYDLICIPHESLGMVGKIIVQ